ncbi:MAG: redoxin domain-containing protein [Clostridia bacterium]|nr:redoxin domain-containing protein [Clostridia bacterium]
MKKMKKALTLFLALLMLATVVLQMVACGGTEDPVDTGSENNVGNATYTVKIKTLGNMPLSDVTVYLIDKDGNIVGRPGVTDLEGVVSFTAPKSNDYSIEISDGVPEGYLVADSYKLSEVGNEVILTSKVIDDEKTDSNFYETGDIMYDFTVTDVNGNEVKLSKLLEKNKAVLLNFWYVDCSWCQKEFPDMNAVYKDYKDKGIEIVALNAVDTNADILSYNKPSSGYLKEPLEFILACDTAGITSMFNVQGFPTSVVIDRYGMISVIESGAIIGESYFKNAFDHFISPVYEQGIYQSLKEFTPVIKPNVDTPTSEAVKDAVQNGDFNATYSNDENEYSWPFVIGEYDGKKVIYPSNKKYDNSYATLYIDIELQAGQAFMFDYFSSTDLGYDVLTISATADGITNEIYSISGIGEEWEKCCAYVAKETGTYRIAMFYVKDESDSEGDDTVYLTNLRVVDSEEVDVETYITRPAVSKPNSTGSDFESYVEIVLGDDGYYHVGTKDGPILLARLMGVTPFTDKFTDRYTVNDTLYKNFVTTDENTGISKYGEFLIDGENCLTAFIRYCNYASNASVTGFCSVTPELKTYLDAFAKKFGTGYHENQWLQMCFYLDSYGTDKEYEDPIKGLTSFSAYEAVMGEPNSVSYSKILLPRGKLYRFVPTESGVYRFRTNSKQEVLGWIFINDHDYWIANGDDRTMYEQSDQGSREPYYTNLVDTGRVDPETKEPIYEVDNTNAEITAYLEAGKEYYVSFAYYDLYGVGTFTFDISYLGSTYDFFVAASSGAFTTELLPGDILGDTISGGVDIYLSADGYFHHLIKTYTTEEEAQEAGLTLVPSDVLPDDMGKYYELCTYDKCTVCPKHAKEQGADLSTKYYHYRGSVLYADFKFPTNIFQTDLITNLIDKGAFNFTRTETDEDAIKNGYVTKTDDELKKLWGDSYEYAMDYYQIDDLRKGIYHGKGEDRTEEIRSYLERMIPETVENPELQGCVMVDEELADLLQSLMDKYSLTNEGYSITHSFAKLCYYYKQLGTVID